MNAQTAMETALAHHRAGRLAQAEAIYRQVLALHPNYPDALHLLGVLALQVGQPQTAADLITRAISLSPQVADFHFNHGAALVALGRFEQAMPAYRAALALRPNYPEALDRLAAACFAVGNKAGAIDAYQRLLDLQPNHAETCVNLGNALSDAGKLDDAIDAFERAIRLRPDMAAGYNNLANALLARGQGTQAVAAYDQAILRQPNEANFASNRLFALQFQPGWNALDILAEHRKWNERFALPLTCQAAPHHNDPSADRRLKIAYLSPDFVGHCQALFTVPLLSNHHHAQFEIHCYADVERPDPATARLRACADVWRTTAGMTDEQIAQQIRQDRIDVLVDLTMHMSRGRPLVLARKPAPVQVAWLAYPGTTGLAAIDFRLTDPYLDPPGQGDECYSETSIRLQDTFWCYDPRAVEEATAASGGPIPEPNELPALKNGFITFGCLNNFCKMNEGLIDLWAAVLGRLPSARLILLAPEGESRRWATQRLAARGVDHGRIDFVPRQPYRRYLREFHRIDIGLDTLPYNGHTTSLDSFWMGVPVLTRVGDTVVGRAGSSQLSNLNLADFAAPDDRQFVEIAATVAGNLDRLAELRRTLRQRMRNSPLMDAPRFARSIESAYRQMWRVWCGRP